MHVLVFIFSVKYIAHIKIPVELDDKTQPSVSGQRGKSECLKFGLLCCVQGCECVCVGVVNRTIYCIREVLSCGHAMA